MNRSLRFLPFIISAFIGLVACQSAGTTPAEKPKDTVAMKANTGTFFDHLLVDNRKDPSCGMPVTAGIHDTAHYKENVLGFCSKECKEAFQKNPELLLAAADIKKK
jgi:YHS domain-containing protein